MTNISSNTRKAGLPPGTLMHLGTRKTEKVRISVMDYSKEGCEEREIQQVEDCFSLKHKDSVSWINVDGLHDTETIAKIGEHFDLHNLLLEDVLNTDHRPKLEEFDNCLFITLKMLGINPERNAIVSEQVSLVLGDGWVISFQEQQGDIFDELRQRIREGKGIIRERGVDYLLYRLIDIVVDNYFFVIDYFNEVIEATEEKVLHNHEDKIVHKIQLMKKQVHDFRKSVLPLRDVVSSLHKGDQKLIKHSTTRYLQDVYEHLIHVSDSIEMHREMLSNIMDLHISATGNKMNQVMQVLTIMSSIFIPLTFIAGIYGMNFQYMPELQARNGYFIVLGVMVAITGGMLVYFRRKKWL